MQCNALNCIELQARDGAEQQHDIPPQAGTALVFLSELVEHEVCAYPAYLQSVMCDVHLIYRCFQITLSELHILYGFIEESTLGFRFRLLFLT